MTAHGFHVSSPGWNSCAGDNIVAGAALHWARRSGDHRVVDISGALNNPAATGTRPPGRTMTRPPRHVGGARVSMSSPSTSRKGIALDAVPHGGIGSYPYRVSLGLYCHLLKEQQ